MPTTTSSEADDLAVRIGKMDQPSLIHHLMNFDPGFNLDFTEAFLADQTIDQLRHILLAAHLQANIRRKREATLAEATYGS
jgi:hypothetical protein